MTKNKIGGTGEETALNMDGSTFGDNKGNTKDESSMDQRNGKENKSSMSEEQKEETKKNVDTNQQQDIKSADMQNQANSTQQVTQTQNLEEKVKEQEAEINELKDKLLRKQADFENSRKRIMREKEESIKYANQNLLYELTSIIDSFERAIKASEEAKDFNTLHNGIELIEQQLVSTLEKKWGLKRFNSVGDVFDPQRHEAIAVVEDDSVKVPTVVEDYQKGYLYNDRVLRPAKVRVAQPRVERKPEEENNNSNNRESK
jgi:molecular chaperone GrpE